MSGKNITPEEIVRGAVQLGQECWNNGRTINQQLEWSKGTMGAEMDNVIFRVSMDLFWVMRKERSRIDKAHEPYTKEYIDAYNQKALEYGMPEHHVVEGE
jgi:hypothetical protein